MKTKHKDKIARATQIPPIHPGEILLEDFTPSSMPEENEGLSGLS